MVDSQVLLVCGMPATGKTTFGDWLRDMKGYLHLDLETRDCLEVNGLPPFWSDRIWNMTPKASTDFVAYLRALDRNVVLTWAFHTDLIPFVGHLVDAGAEPWWFEGERLAARAVFAARRTVLRDGVYTPGTPDIAACDRYVASIVAHWSKMEPIFGGNVIHTLGADGTYAAPEQILSAIEDHRRRGAWLGGSAADTNTYLKGKGKEA